MKEQRFYRKAVSSLLTILFVVFSTGLIYAQFAGGQGTEDDPWQIARPADLNNIRGQQFLAGHYIQTADIDLSPEAIGGEDWYDNEGGWQSIGDSDNEFRGTYDGDGFTISGMTANRPADNAQSLFGRTVGATIKNVQLREVDLTGRRDVGALVGRMTAQSLVENSSATGNVASPNEWMQGGLVGYVVDSRVVNSWADVDVQSGGGRAGGLVGWLRGDSQLVNCFAKGSVTSPQGVGVNGGLVGLMHTGAPSISNCYARGNVTVGSNQVGGLVGTHFAGTISHSYATGLVTGTGGGLVGQASGDPVSDSYWDTETTGKEESAGGGAGRLTRQMIYPYDLNEAFVRWDFQEIWVQDSAFENEVNPGVNDGYPYLFYQEPDEPDLLDTPEIISISIREEDGVERVYIRWEAVDEANSYKIFSAESTDPEDDEWGEPIGVTGQTEFSQEIDGHSRYFFITASPEEAP